MIAAITKIIGELTPWNKYFENNLNYNKSEILRLLTQCVSLKSNLVSYPTGIILWTDVQWCHQIKGTMTHILVPIFKISDKILILKYKWYYLKHSKWITKYL